MCHIFRIILQYLTCKFIHFYVILYFLMTYIHFLSRNISYNPIVKLQLDHFDKLDKLKSLWVCFAAVAAILKSFSQSHVYFWPYLNKQLQHQTKAHLAPCLQPTARINALSEPPHLVGSEQWTMQPPGCRCGHWLTKGVGALCDITNGVSSEKWSY